MSIVASILFALAGFAAILTIWKSTGTALAAFRSLRAQLSEASQERIIHVTTLDLREPVEAPAETRRSFVRPYRYPHSKPVTYRLQQFPHRTHAA